MVFLAISVSLMFHSCATLFTGTSDNISITTKPEGAEIFIEGIKYGSTPATISVKRSLSDKEVVLKIEGYEPIRFKLQKEFNLVALLNFGGMIGWVIDAATGSIYKYDPRSYAFDLKKIEIAQDISNLKRDKYGNLIITSTENVVLVKDSKHDVLLVFKK